MTAPKQQPDVDFFTKAEAFYEQHKKLVTGAVSAVLVLVLGLIAFFGYYVPSKEKEAQEQMYHAQDYFAVDSFALALNGDGNYDGFLDIIDNYAFTKAAGLSNYYAGLCYLHLGNFDDAVEYLKDYSGSDPIVSASALAALGDAYSEKSNMDEAISYYKKAADKAANDVQSPMYLFKAGLALKSQGNKEAALEIFKKIKTNYPNSNEGQDIDKYIAMVS